MTFKKSEVTLLLDPAKDILIKLGHKITSDWLRYEDGASHVTYAEDRFVDALSIFCSDPECNMRFDINQSSNRSSYGSYLLWYGCGCLAEMKIVKSNPPEFVMDRMSVAVEKRFLCKKIKALL